MKSFICVECEDVRPARSLADHALAISGAENKQDALEVLPEHEHICERCQQEIQAEADSMADGSIHGRSEFERWALSGLALSKVELDWLHQYA